MNYKDTFFLEAFDVSSFLPSDLPGVFINCVYGSPPNTFNGVYGDHFRRRIEEPKNFTEYLL